MTCEVREGRVVLGGDWPVPAAGETWLLDKDGWARLQAAIVPIWDDMPEQLMVDGVGPPNFPAGHYLLRLSPAMAAKLRSVFDPDA